MDNYSCFEPYHCLWQIVRFPLFGAEQVDSGSSTAKKVCCVFIGNHKCWFGATVDFFAGVLCHHKIHHIIKFIMSLKRKKKGQHDWAANSPKHSNPINTFCVCVRARVCDIITLQSIVVFMGRWMSPKHCYCLQQTANVEYLPATWACVCVCMWRWPTHPQSLLSNKNNLVCISSLAANAQSRVNEGGGELNPYKLHWNSLFERTDCLLLLYFCLLLLALCFRMLIAFCL